jgi:hypothetical protein
MAKQQLSEIERKIKNTSLKEIDYRYQSTVSYSQYSIYRSCPHRWFLQYVKNLAPYQASIQTLFGTAMHETLQNYLKVMYDVSGAEADRIDLISDFNTRFRENYKKEFESTKTHFTSPDEMREFFDDGISILEWFKKHRKQFFLNRNTKLLGIEMPLMVGLSKNLFLKGFIDLVLYNENEDKVYIYDIKTSRQGWNDKAKKDEIKLAQILLYKEYFAKQYNIDVDKIEVEFFIIKRKIWESKDFPIPYISSFKPASGKIKRKQAVERFNQFLTECFDNEGKHVIKSYPKQVSKDSCTYCPFKDNKELCDKNVVS